MDMTRRNFVASAAAVAASMGVAGTALAAEKDSAKADAAAASGAKDGAQAAKTASAASDGTTNPGDVQSFAADPSNPIPTWGVEPLDIDWLGTKPEIAASDIAQTKETDLLIIGAGNAGMVAAATASDAGMDFIVAEKTGVLGTTRNWYGVCNSTQCIEAGKQADPMFLLNEIERYTNGKADQDVIKVWIDKSAEMSDWLVKIMDGYGFDVYFETNTGEEGGVGGCGYYCAPTQHNFVARKDTAEDVAKTPRNMLLEDYISKQGHEVSYNYDLVELVRQGDGPVTGAIFATPDGFVQVNAKNTILTTGGYAGNPEMMAALQPDAVAVTTADSYNPGNKGEGIKAGMWAGAAKQSEPTPMLFDRGAVDPGVDAGYEVVNGKPGFRGRCTQRNILSQPFLKVNRDGKRFANESASYDNVCFALLNQPGGVFCQVFDGNAREDIIRFRQTGCAAVTRLYMEAGGDIDDYLEYVEDETFKKADTLEELAELLGFEGEARDAFLKTIDEYNAMYDAQQDTQYGKEAYRLSAIRTAPFYGCWAGASLLTTLDGLRINADMQVLGADLKPIEGLYAAGDCSGDFFATNYPEFIVGSAAGRTTVEGRHVAKEVAALEGIDVEKADAAAKKALAAAVTDTSGDDADYVTNGAMVAW